MAQPANLNSMHEIDTETLAAGAASVMESTETLAEPVDPAMEKIADVVAAAAAAAAAAQVSKGSTPSSVKMAARSAAMDALSSGDT